MGLPTFQPAFSNPDIISADRAAQVKLTTALTVVEGERRPLIWTDDDAVPSHGPDADRLRTAGVPTLLIAPIAGCGLRAMDMTAIEIFASDPWSADAATDATVLVALAMHARSDGTAAYPTAIDTIMSRTRLGEHTVRESLARMEKAAVIRRGDQSLAAHFRPDDRPVVWDITCEVSPDDDRTQRQDTGGPQG